MTNEKDRPEAGEPDLTQPTSDNSDNEETSSNDAPSDKVRAERPSDASEDGVRNLLRGAFTKEETEVPDVLRGVQRKLRKRSRGKFYSDGWSTEKQPPINTYLVTSLVMLAIIFFVWAVLSPLSGEPAPVEPPAPVQVVPGPQHRTP